MFGKNWTWWVKVVIQVHVRRSCACVCVGGEGVGVRRQTNVVKTSHQLWPCCQRRRALLRTTKRVTTRRCLAISSPRPPSKANIRRVSGGAPSPIFKKREGEEDKHTPYTATILYYRWQSHVRVFAMHDGIHSTLGDESSLWPYVSLFCFFVFLPPTCSVTYRHVSMMSQSL